MLVLLGIAISGPLTAWLVAAGRRMSILDSPGAVGHGKTLRPIPNIGGVAIFWTIAGPLLLGLLGLEIAPETMMLLAPGLGEHQESISRALPVGYALLGGMALLHAVGLYDDRRSLSPWIKLLMQLLVALMMVIFFDTRLLTLLDAYGTWGMLLSIGLTVAWIVVVTNSLNFMDNMDGLAGGVAAIAGSFFLWATLLNHQWFIAAAFALMIGGLVGFLIFNFPPARIFMGDGGSLVVGFMLAILSVRTAFIDPADPGYALGNAWYGIFMPLVVLALPLYDVTTVTMLRISQGRSPMVGDEQHFSHRLVRRGFSPRGAVLLIWGLSLVTGTGGILLGSVPPWLAIVIVLLVLMMLAMTAFLEHMTTRFMEQVSD